MGGIEVLPFGLLIFVAGALIIVNAWAVIDAKLTVEASAREATRSFTEADDVRTGDRLALVAARSVVEGSGRDPDRLVLQRRGNRLVRCAVVEYRAQYRVAAITIPFIGSYGRGTTVTGRHSDVVDPFRAGLGPSSDCDG